jgi:hypothetical protein
VKTPHGNIMPMRIDSKRSEWLSMHYNSHISGEGDDLLLPEGMVEDTP